MTSSTITSTIQPSIGPSITPDSGGVDLLHPEILADSPIAYWRLDGNGADEIGSNDLTLQNSPSFTTPILGGGQALALDGVDQYAEATGYSPALTFPFTIECVFRLDALAVQSPIFNTHHLNDIYAGLSATALTSGAFAMSYGDGAGPGSGNRKTFVTSAGVVASGVDYHLVVRAVDFNTVDVYLNDVLTAAPFSSGTAASLSVSAGIPGIGVDIISTTVDRFSEMTADSTVIYNALLSTGRITAHFNATGI